MTTQTQSTLCTLRHWVQLDQGYDLEFPIDQLSNAIALCGWTAANNIRPRSPEVLAELDRLGALEALDIPDGRRWFKRFGKPVERRPDPGPRMGEDNYRDGDGEGCGYVIARIGV